MIRRTFCAAAAFALGLALFACSPQQEAAVQTRVANFEQQAAPAIAAGCARFHQAETDPLVQLAVAGGTMAAGLAPGGGAVATLAVGAIKSFGDSFCAGGPPAGDTTTVAQQAQWIAGVAAQLVSAAAQAAATH